MNKDISKKIVGQIKKEKISPKPRVFNYKSFLFWLIFGLLIILGGIAFSLILISIFSFGRDVFQYASGGFLKIVLISIPYFWVILFATFAFFGLKAFRLTKYGYRQSFILILTIIILASFSLGALLYILGIGKIMHRAMADNIPRYHQMTPTKESQWARPEMGMMGGEIVNVGRDFIVVKDLKNRNIKVIYLKDTIIGGNVKLEKGERVRVVGERIDVKTFRAKIIRPWDDGKMLKPGEREKLIELRDERVKRL